MNLFGDEENWDEQAPLASDNARDLPLAARMRPRHFDEYAGQAHIIGREAPLRRAVEADRLPSCLFYGPAGTGKTTLARLIAGTTRAHFDEFSAISGGVADVRRIIEAARQRRKAAAQSKAVQSTLETADDKASARNAPANPAAGRTILFVDEIHRFNRAQQDAFLPHVEDGTVTLIGATTENPLAAINTPLLSRCRLFRFEALSDADIIGVLERALKDARGLADLELQVEALALQHIAACALGDARTALNSLEMASDLARPSKVLSLALAETAVQRRALDYDQSGDNHYDMISAYIKSLRGGDPDAALYWMARMLEGGEDPMFIARRLVIQSSEDIGNADPRALPLAMAALGAVEKIGLPEAAIPLAQATVFVATCAKSNASYVALHRAQDMVRDHPPARVPQHLRSTALRGAKEQTGAGNGYIYPHDVAGHFARQDYLPPDFKGAPFYEPSDQGYEIHIARRLNEWWSDAAEDE